MDHDRRDDPSNPNNPGYPADRAVHPSLETPPFADPMPEASAVLPEDRDAPSVLSPDDALAGAGPHLPSGTPLPPIPKVHPEAPVEDPEDLHVERAEPHH